MVANCTDDQAGPAATGVATLSVMSLFLLFFMTHLTLYMRRMPDGEVPAVTTEAHSQESFKVGQVNLCVGDRL